MLEVSDLRVHYGRIAALQGISLEVHPAEIVSGIGPNGAGKTTLLSTIIGLVSPSHGEVFLDGQPLTGLPPEAIVRRGIALVPEGRHIFTKLTVLENLRLGLTPRSGGNGGEDIERALE